MRRIYVAGHNGMVGSALVRKLSQVAGIDLILRSRDQLDLTCQKQVQEFFREMRADEVYLAAALVGGIHANNTYPADFIGQNLLIESNVIGAAHESGVQKLLFLGSSCIYPRLATQPVSEDALLSGYLEPTNEPYAIAKIAGIKLCESYNRQFGRDYRSVMPANLYGPGDNFHPEHSHVVPALMRRFHAAVQNGAQEVVVWGSGKPMREFLHVDDMAAACIHVMNIPHAILENLVSPMCSHLNVGTGQDCSIENLAGIIAEVTGFKGKLVFDSSKPDGAPRKLLDVTKLGNAGWHATIPLEAGIKDTYQWFLSHQDDYRR